MQFKLPTSTIEQIELYSQLLKKDSNQILQEALESYFAQIEKELLENNLENENKLTSFSNEEFWDGVDI
ncbi:MAG TPA: hypothetical protein ENL00_02440 [Nitratifractor sp.]|jgi:hypothetical protein|nr:hypothetical protein [Nitratifractor sp.]